MTYGQALAQAKAEAYTKWFDRANVFADVNGQLHAGPGGAIGANGEEYAHGQFIATSQDTIKGELVIEKTRMILKELWTADPDLVALAARLAGYDGSNGFILSLQCQLEERCTLSSRQVEAAGTALDREEEKIITNANSEFIGTVGERGIFAI